MAGRDPRREIVEFAARGDVPSVLRATAGYVERSAEHDVVAATFEANGSLAPFRQ